jgi:hypothetical protein
MKTVAIFAAAAAIMATTSAYANPMPETHEPGAPTRQGNYCWTSTNEYGAGWWQRCGDKNQFRGRGRSIVVQIPDPPPPPTYNVIGEMNEVDGSGDGGGGGGGGGGR